MKRIFFSILAIAMVATMGAREVEVKLYHTTDVHGNYFPYDFINRTPWQGSLARVQTAIKQARAEHGNNVILLNNGDILQGQPTAYYYNFIDTVSPHVASEILSYMGYDAGNVGNHVVETGRRVLDRWASQCAMPVLGANIIDTLTNQPHFQPYKMIEKDGVKIAVLGMITPGIPAWLPENLWAGLRFDDMEETARKWLPIIREKEQPDVIVGLFHAGQAGNVVAGRKENPSLEIARNVPGFDVVLMGHDHQADIKWVENAEGDSVLAINPANNAVAVSDVTMRFTVDDATGKVSSKKISGELLSMDAYEPDSAFMARFAPAMKAVEAYVAEPIGTMSRTISTRDAYFGPSEFVDLVHELQLGISGAEISMSAPLSFDVAIPEGVITVGDMFNLYKYENMLYVMELTGQEVKDYLEESYALWTNQMKSPDDHLLLLKDARTKGEAGRSVFVNRPYNFDSAAGIIYTVDVTKPKGEKVTIEKMANGEAFSPERVYRVALNSYRGNGGGELLTKGAGIDPDRLSERIVWSTPLDLRYYLTEYIRKQGTVNPRKLNQWKFVPEAIVAPAAARDRAILFPD